MQEISQPANPFPGLRPFESTETHLFFGRDGQSEELLRRLKRTRFLAVVGTSGSGKSSLVRAGLLPALQGGLMASAGSDWRIAILRPGGDPIGNLARALAGPAVLGSRGKDDAGMQAVMAETTLRRSSLGLVELVSRARTKVDDSGQPVFADYENLLVVVDQFEELFRFKQLIEEENSKEDAAAFVKLLLEAVGQKDEQKIYVVLTMRSDFLGDCSQFFELPEAINNGQYLIPRMTRDERREAISGPVAVGQGAISEPLVNQLLNDVGDNPDQLPILQHALMRTWDHWLTHRNGNPIDIPDYNAIGGMAEALSRHADEAYAELNDAQKLIAEKLFKGLTEKGTDNREIRRPMEVQEICELTGAREAAVIAVIEVFRREGRSFLMPPPTDALSGEPVRLNRESLIDISHESLIRNWERLKIWVDEESRSARIYRRLAETAVLHKEGGAGLWRDPDLGVALTWREQSAPNQVWARRYHPEFPLAMDFLDASVAARDAQLASEEARRRKEIKRTRLTAGIFAVAFLFSLGMGAYAYGQKIQAVNALIKAEELRVKAENAEEQTKAQAIAAKEQAANARHSEKMAKAAEEAALVKTKEAEESNAKAEKQEQIASEQRQEAIRQRDHSRQLLYASDVNLAMQSYEDNNITGGRLLLNAHSPEKGDAPGFEWYYLNRLLNSEALLTFDSPVYSLAVSRDGKTLAVRRFEGVESVNVVSGQRRVIATKEPTSTALAADGSLLFVNNLGSNEVQVLNASTLEEKERLKPREANVKSIAVSTDGTLAIGYADDVTLLWDVAKHHERASFKHKSEPSGSTTFSRDDQVLAVRYKDGGIGLWDVASRLEVCSLAGSFRQVAFSPDSRQLAAADDKEGAVLFDVRSCKRSGQFGDKVMATSVAFSPGGEMLAVGYDDIVKVWDTGSHQELATLKGHKLSVQSIVFSADGRTLWTGCNDQSVRRWDVAADVRRQSPLLKLDEGISAVAFSPDGKTIATASDKYVFRLWDADTLQEKGTPIAGKSWNNSLAYSPKDGVLAVSVVATDESGETVLNDAIAGFWLWDAGTREKLFEFRERGGLVSSFAYSPDGRRLVTVSYFNNKIKLWDATSHKEEKRLEGFQSSPICVAFSRDGKLIAVGFRDGIVKVWNSTLTEELASFSEKAPSSLMEPNRVTSLAFSPDSRNSGMLAIGFARGYVKLWDATARKELAKLEGHNRSINSIAFSPDGMRLATGSADKTAKLWDMTSFKELLTLRGHTEGINSLAFSPDGETLVTASDDKTVRLWRAPRRRLH